jgi:hypothetical protein
MMKPVSGTPLAWVCSPDFFPQTPWDQHAELLSHSLAFRNELLVKIPSLSKKINMNLKSDLAVLAFSGCGDDGLFYWDDAFLIHNNKCSFRCLL